MGTPHLGEDAKAVAALADGSDAFADILKKAERPAIIIGTGLLARSDAPALLAHLADLAQQAGVVAEGWNGFNILHTAASRVGALDLGFVPGEGGKATAEILDAAASGEIEVVYNLGCDELDMTKLDKAFVIYQGHHGDAGANGADVVLPGAAYTEQNGIYVNLEGRVQMAQRAYFPFGEAREDWAIVRALSGKLGAALPYDDLFSLRQAMIADAPVLGRLDHVEAGTGVDFAKLGAEGPVLDAPLRSSVSNYYFTNSIARASPTMSECSKAAVTNSATVSDGSVKRLA